MYRVLVVEDDASAHARLAGLIEQYGRKSGEQFQLVWQRSAIDLMGANARYDLVFLDIDLPGINGIEAAELLRTYDRETPLVFVTNLAQHVAAGYDVEAIGFLVKPVEAGAFALCMERAMRIIRRNQGATMSVRLKEGMRVFSQADLIYIEVTGHSLSYHVAGEDEALVVRGTLSAVEAELPSTQFVRISNSCLVNMAHIQRVRKGELDVTGGDTLWFSRPKRRDAMAAIASYLGGSI